MKLFVLAMILTFTAPSFAQKHMIDFNPTNVFLGSFTLSQTKYKGEDANRNDYGLLFLNYAFGVTDHLQVGASGSYSRSQAADYKSESRELLVGGYYNLDTDFRNSYFIGLFAGFDWNSTKFTGAERNNTEDLKGRLSLGKRIPLSMLKLENVTYSPEIMLASSNPTKSTSTNQIWTQELIIRFIQFSVFF